VGDGGVLKTVRRAGTGSAPVRGSTVEVHYEGFLADGTPFDSSRSRGKPFTFTLGDGKVIGGWEIGVAAMRQGEQSTLLCASQYAYGQKGIPPTIPPAATLRFEVELLSVKAPADGSYTGTFASDAPETPRTPDSIQRAYQLKLDQKAPEKEGLEGFVEWAKKWYIFGLFANPGERPPWYLNPLITFPAIFAVVGVGFYLVVALGGLHRGEVPVSGDDISAFIGETVPPMDVK